MYYSLFYFFHSFGSRIRSTVTGIIYNNQMDDFSTPGLINAYGVEPSPSNFIEPGKRPMSSMSPVIFTDPTSGDVEFIAGASGGTRITTGTSLVSKQCHWEWITVTILPIRRVRLHFFVDFLTVVGNWNPGVTGPDVPSLNWSPRASGPDAPLQDQMPPFITQVCQAVLKQAFRQWYFDSVSSEVRRRAMHRKRSRHSTNNKLF